MNIFSQVVEHPVLYDLGLAGLVIGWFMLRYEKRSDAADKKYDVMISELRATKHGLNGLNRTLLVMEVNRRDGTPEGRQLAEGLLHQIPIDQQRNSNDGVFGK